MSELFYKGIRAWGMAVFGVASRTTVLHRERAERAGAYLLAANHESPFDAALLIAATPRVIYWLSIVELFQNPFTRWFLSSMLAAPLDRSRVDTTTVRRIARHLRSGRVVGLFPEGTVRTGEDSVLAGGQIKDGIAKLAELGRVPVFAVCGGGGEEVSSLGELAAVFRTRWAVAFGEPIELRRGGDRARAHEDFTRELEAALRRLHEEVKPHV